MPSRLSSLLVRDGLVGVKRMEKAFQRQVIYGGSLDTILLEMNLVPEDRLTQYLALASGLPPAARDEGLNAIDGEALWQITSEIAAQFRAVPLSMDGEALRVLVCSPLEIGELEDLADLLDRPLQPLITPEYRWHLVYARAYKVDAPARFATLERQLQVDAAALPVGRAKSIIIEDPVATLAAHDTDPEHTVPMVPAPPTVPRPSDGRVAMPAPSNDKTEKTSSAGSEAPDSRVRSHTLIGIKAPSEGKPPPIPTEPAVIVDSAITPSTGVPRQIAHIQPAKLSSSGIRGTSEPMATAGRDSPLAVVRARELLATADDRDTVFLTLLRAARARSRYAGLLTVQGGAAIGRLALAETGIDVAAIQKVLIPLDIVSPFRTVVSNQQPHIGALASGDPGVDAMVMRLGGTMPPSALLMPIVLRDRVVAIVVAHRVHSDLKLVDVTELLPLASGAADALGRLIVKHKSAGYRAPAAEAPNVQIEDERIDTKKIVRKDAEWRTPAPASRPSVPELGGEHELTITAEPPRPIADVINDIELSKEAGADDAINDAVERAPETLGELAKRFPGKLRVDRFSVTGRPLRAAQYGGLLELVVRLGSVASELLIDRMSSPQRDIRFYATVCAAELRPRNAVFALVERVFDQDYGVRNMAIEALSGYPVADLTQALVRARNSVHSEDPEVVGAASAAIVQLGDIESISDLIDAIERGDRGADHVRKALIALTAQDFGLSEKKWRKWYETARKRHRIEWLIEGLVHKDDGIRETAINDLRRLTGEYFGYHHDLPRKERDMAAERWSSWWRETGMRRFVHQENERHRPTAQLPARRE